MPIRRIRVAAIGLAFMLCMPVVSFAADTTGGKIPANAISILDCGATPNDDTDDLDSINKCIADAKAKGKTVYVPNGTFIYSDVITIDGVDLTGEGSASVLRSINPERQSILMDGDGSDLSNVKLTTVPVKDRLQTPESARVYVGQNAVNFTIKNIEIDGGSSGGIINFGNHGVISGNMVRNTLADGIHNTGGSSNILIENNICRDTGDDQIAVVSYENDQGVWSKNITIRNNDVSGGHARGITVSGGEDITIENNKIADTGGAGVFIASEGSWETYAALNITVKNNIITRDSQDAQASEKGGIRLQATYKDPSIQNALFENNTISDSGDSGILIVGSAAISATFRNNTIKHPKGYGINIVKTVKGELTFEKNTISGPGKDAYFNASTDAKVTSDMTNAFVEGGNTDAGNGFAAIKGTPIIDGQIDDLWKNATALQMDETDQGTTGTAKVAWDEKALYFLFEMKDNTLHAAGKDENNDSIEVWVDELNAKDRISHYQIRVDINNVVTSGMEDVDLTNVKSAVTKGNNSYIVELEVPYRKLSPAAGDIIGFNASANDDVDGDGIRDNYVSWVDKNMPYWADTTVYNEVVLAASVKSTSSTPIRVSLNGQIIVFPTNPVIVNNKTLVNAEDLVRALGAEYHYDAGTGVVSITKHETKITLKPKAKEAQVNGSPQVLDVPAAWSGDKLLLPLRFTAEQLGYSVGWVAEVKEVTITG